MCLFTQPVLVAVSFSWTELILGEFRDKWQQQIKEFYEYITLKLLKEKSCKLAGINQVDITREYVSDPVVAGHDFLR